VYGADVLPLLLEHIRSRYFGKYRGTVVDNQDPTTRGRLKVRVPAVLAALEVWAMPCVPYAGDGVGFLSLPAADAGVWVEFEGGDPSFPIWVGCFWADGEAPEQADPEVKVWKTSEHTVRLDDAATELKLETSSAASITLTDAVVTDAGGSTHTVGTDGVASESGIHKAEVTPTSFKVNDGALEVM
jgi:uncharacterized protein involved in type VI secretion and phage assembly